MKQKKINLSNFKIMDKLGGGAFGSVYLVTPNVKQQKGKEKYYAMKVLEKEKVIKQNLARYALTERNVLSIAGMHPFIVGLDFAF